MATIAPFNGIHYDSTRSLSELLAPPYDIIDEAEHRELARKHPHNVIHLTLGAPGRKRDYKQIGKKLRQWIREGVMVRDEEPSFYAYCQEYVFEGHPLKFWGIVSLLKLEPFGKGRIFPHEAVMPGPVEDRLKIMEATRANLEPIMTLYRQPSDPLSMLFESLEAFPPSMAASLPNKTKHRVWRLSLPRTCVRIQRALKRLPFFVADGHHRYHAAWMFHQKHRTLKTARWYMTLVANTEQKGLKIMPINRALECSVPLGKDLPVSFSRFGRVELTGHGLGESLLRPARGTLGFYCRKAGGWILHLPPLPADAKLRDQLDVVRLHEILPQTVKVTDSVFPKDPREAARRAKSAPNQLACFLPPPPSHLVLGIAFGGRILPQKSTFFLPKPQSGIILRTL